ncbi:MAG: 2-isopropylmalate synthase [Oscillospiraceae bacterium]|nr:2-isopropylmalate synthase [Oscillospiraceae bacterium]
MKNVSKYTKGYYLPPESEKYNNWVKRTTIDKAPTWCSVDLRDGNQSLIVPMTLQEKLDFFNFLVKIGFKEIEVGFPAASETEYEFCRALIEKNLIPDDVAIQVLTQSREHIIRKTFDALRGAKNAIVHFYNSTSVVQREQVFKKSKDEITNIAVTGATLIKQLANEYEGNFRFEYSPESFTGTEPEYGLEICNAVLEILEPTPDNKVIINLPATVEVSLPHVFANQVEYMCANLHKRENVVVSLHAHNDRGCAVAATELGLLAGADRVEGTLFGNGERTGNTDIITVALNMYSQGVEPGLDFSNISEVVDIYERVTDLDVHARHPYSGELVFAAFSGSHQDAIAKGMAHREKLLETNSSCVWNVPYLPIDPSDVGRKYDSDVIRVNSQSGKGGIGHILERYGYNLPPEMRESVGYAIKDLSDKENKELSPDDVLTAFLEMFKNVKKKIRLKKAKYYEDPEKRYNSDLQIEDLETNIIHTISGSGVGYLDAICNALKKHLNIEFDVGFQMQTSMKDAGAKSQAIAYVEIIDKDGNGHWGMGLRTNTTNANATAVVSAINRSGLI